MENFDNEIWKDIPNYENLYQASNLGRIRSYKRFGTSGKVLTAGITKNYCKVILSKNGTHTNHSVHKLVWLTFVGEIPEGYEINHIDENPSNNALSNLSLVTHRENINWGTRNKKVSLKMVNGKLSKQVLQYDLNGCFLKEWASIREITRQLGYNRKSISYCCRQKYGFKTAYGYIWKFKKGEC